MRDIMELAGGIDMGSPLVLLLAKATLILLLALAVTRVMRAATAGARHLVWLVALVAIVLVPVLAAWGPIAVPVLERGADAAHAGAGYPDAAQPPSFAGGDRSGAPAPLAGDVPRAADSGPAAGPAGHPVAVAGGSFPIGTALRAIGVVWLAVLGAILASLLVGVIRVRKVIRGGTVIEEPGWLEPLWEIADRVGLDDPPVLVRSTAVKMPFACGLLQPTIVLPDDSSSWPLDRRRAVLLHELAHIRRRDILGHLLGRVACAVYWFHPLVWAAARELRAESERACDDLALSCGARPADYAEHLLDIVSSVRGDATPAVAVAMARRQEFEGRMLAILDPDLPHRLPGRAQSLALIASLAVVTITIGAAVPTQRADAATTVPAQIIRRPGADVPGDWVNPDELQLPTKDHGRGDMATASASAAASASADASASASGSAAPGVPSDAAMRALAAAADERPALLANVLRTERSAELRRVAAWGLAEYASEPVASAALAHAARNDADVSVREMAVWALAEADEEPAVIAALEAALRDADVKVRATAAWTLGNLEAESSTGALVGALSDADAGVRARAAWALGNVEPDRAPAQLTALLRDPDKRVRMVAAWALYAIEDPGAAPALTAAMRAEQDKELRMLYVRAIAAMGEASVDAIRGLLDSPEPEVKAAAVRALAGGDAAGPWPWPWPMPRPHP